MLDFGSLHVAFDSRTVHQTLDLWPVQWELDSESVYMQMLDSWYVHKTLDLWPVHWEFDLDSGHRALVCRPAHVTIDTGLVLKESNFRILQVQK